MASSEKESENVPVTPADSVETSAAASSSSSAGV
eukprot:CAMPEP_0183779250 /NCGR_PEP_ID=MMETSP0739-20130205/53521_1 /TAXON_ID=385413 /ORGANISM="Thalassiosira miniscula, Strain CCMP1093" /LENGTH=33 /DNA_ID= /DNA_START= /DNA_END= /DNA_ORIENTATION=